MKDQARISAALAGIAAVLRAGLLAALMIVAGPGAARGQDARAQGILDFIGGIESRGYDDYYREAAAPPPRPLTTMTVAEVLAWQESIDARSRSEAAGKYQIMEDTLRGLADAGAVPPDALFNAATQDALALHLLERRGYDPARTDYTRMGDAIAREWAALPVCSGLRAGRSHYDGIAGNTARTTCGIWLAVLENPDNPAAVADAIALSRLVEATRDAGDTALDDFLDDVRETFFGLSEALIPIATALLFSLVLIDWVMTTARQVLAKAGIGAYLAALLPRIVLAGVFLFLIDIANYNTLVIASAEALLGVAANGASINVTELFDGLISLTWDIFGRSWYNIPDKLAAGVILVVGAILIGFIITAYIEVYIAFASAFIALGFAGWSGTRHIAVRYLTTAAAKVLYLFAALFCGALISSLIAFDAARESGSPLALSGIMIVIAIVMISIPAAVETAMTGRSGPSAAGTPAGLIAKGAFFAVKAPLKMAGGKLKSKAKTK